MNGIWNGVGGGAQCPPYCINYPTVMPWSIGLIVQREDCYTYSGSFYQTKSAHTTATGKEPTSTIYWTNLGTLTAIFGASSKNTESTFKTTWDYVVDRFQSGISPYTNVKFCFDVGSWPSYNASWYTGANANSVTFSNIYPIDSNVDSVGFELYYPGSTSEQIFGMYNEILAKVSYNKVIAIAEGGTTNADKQAKADWIAAAYSSHNIKLCFPRVSSVIIWDDQHEGSNPLSFMETTLIKGAIMACLQEYKGGQ
jgi:hypothetical protein